MAPGLASGSRRLLIAASGTGGHIFPALAVAQQLPDWQVEWLGVPDRLEVKLVQDYPLHRVAAGGFQGPLGLGTLRTGLQLIRAIWQVRRLLKKGQFSGVFTTGGYIAAPAILAARSLGIPVLMHESNALPGKVTRWFGPACTVVALGFAAAASYLPKARTLWTGTPVRSDFLVPAPLTLPIPDSAPLIVVVGGSQGAIAVNQLVRQAAPAWFAAGAWVVHLVGDRDPDAYALEHPQYLPMPFFDNMAALLQRADLAVSRAGAGTLTELAIAKTPAILIPYPFAADDHQTVNAKAFADCGAARVFPQGDLTARDLQDVVLDLLDDLPRRERMARNAAAIAVPDSAIQLAQLIERYAIGSHR